MTMNVGQKKPPLPEIHVQLLTDAFKTHQDTSPGWHASPHELCRLHMFSDGWFRYCGSAQRGVRWCPEDANWQKYPDNVRALRMLVEELIRPFFQTQNMLCMDDLQQSEEGP